MMGQKYPDQTAAHIVLCKLGKFVCKIRRKGGWGKGGDWGIRKQIGKQ